MKLSEAGELSLLDTLRKRFGKRRKGVVLGIGDDSAVINAGGRNMLLTTDMMAEGVHFDMRWTTPFQLGFKLVSVNVSDIFAMGGSPAFLLLNFAAPGDLDKKVFNRLFDGIESALKLYNLSLVGGDISSSDKLVLSATVTGYADRVLGRSGASAGDRIYVTGPLGDAACGLHIMKNMKAVLEIEKGRRSGLKGPKSILPLVTRHLMPVAKRPDRFVKSATAMMDISDGLLLDLSRLCRESRVGARIFRERVPLSDELKSASKRLGLDPYELALTGGEDYELLFTAPEDKKVEAFCIGEITKSGIRIVDDRGVVKKIMPQGYQHFSV